MFYSAYNHALFILEDLGFSNTITKDMLLAREQFYLDMLFNSYSDKVLNISVIAGSTLGVKHSIEFINKRSGVLNPMYSREKSPEFISMQTRDKRGPNNPQYGVIKTPETIAKLSKYISVYEVDTKKYLGQFQTVECSKYWKIGKDTV